MIESNESDLEVRLNTAFDLLESGDTIRARLSFEALRDQLPTHPTVAFGCGAAAMLEKDFPAAEGFLREAILLAPGVAEFHETLAKSLFAQEKSEEAEAGFRRALEIAPNLVESRANLALIEMANGRLGEAISNLTVAVELRPGDPDIRIRLGSALWNTSRFEEALTQFDAARDQSADPEETTLILMERNHSLARVDAVDELIASLPAEVSSVAKLPVVAGCHLPVIARGPRDVEGRWTVYEDLILSLAEKHVSFGIYDLPVGNCNFLCCFSE
jgi:Flp pilus assembly protein TadD